MALAGQCSNQNVKAAWEKPASVLDRVREAEPADRPTPQPRQARRPGQVLRLVVAVLREAEGTMRGCEVRDAVIVRLGEEVSWSTVRYGLGYAVARPEHEVEGVGWGLYE